MNYKKIYDQFIKDRRKKEKDLSGYTEIHHVIPRSLGGTDCPGNLIKLSASDHFFCHLLLSKIHSGKMAIALSFMCSGLSRSSYGVKPKRWAYEYAKNEMSKYQKLKYSGEGNPFYGMSHTDETKKIISKNRTGKMKGEKHFAYGKASPLRGRKSSDEAKRKNSISKMGEKNPMYGKFLDKNPNYNHSIMEFKNKNNGGIFVGTQRELINKFSLEFRNVSAVVAGKRKTCSGWQLVRNIS